MTGYLTDGNLASGANVALSKLAVPGVLQPGDLGFLEWTFDPSMGDSGNGLPALSGAQQLTRVTFRQSQTWTQASIIINSTGSGLVSGQNFIAAFRSDGTRIGVSADMTTQFGSTGYKSSGSLGSTTTAAGDYIYVVLLCNATTPPHFHRSSGGSNSLTTNGSLANDHLRSATNGTSKTVVDASLTLSSNSASGSWVWAGVS